MYQFRSWHSQSSLDLYFGQNTFRSIIGSFVQTNTTLYHFLFILPFLYVTRLPNSLTPSLKYCTEECNHFSFTFPILSPEASPSASSPLSDCPDHQVYFLTLLCAQSSLVACIVPTTFSFPLSPMDCRDLPFPIQPQDFCWSLLESPLMIHRTAEINRAPLPVLRR